MLSINLFKIFLNEDQVFAVIVARKFKPILKTEKNRDLNQSD